MFVRPCCQSRIGPATFILALSTLLVICGILMAIAAQMVDSAKLTEEFKPARDKRKLAVRTLVAVTAVLFVAGFWGIATYKIRNRVFVSIFGLGTSALVVILAATGTIFSALANLSDEEMNAVCPALVEAGKSAKIESFEPLVEIEKAMNEIDDLNVLSSYYMCSPICPCLMPSETTISSWTEEQNWLNIEEKTLV